MLTSLPQLGHGSCYSYVLCTRHKSRMAGYRLAYICSVLLGLFCMFTLLFNYTAVLRQINISLSINSTIPTQCEEHCKHSESFRSMSLFLACQGNFTC